MLFSPFFSRISLKIHTFTPSGCIFFIICPFTFRVTSAHKTKVSEGRKRLSDEVQLANDAKQWVEAIQEYANITELDAATLNRLIKEIVVHERIDEDKTRHISIEIHFNLKPIPEVEQVTA